MHPAEEIEFENEVRDGVVSVIVVCYNSLDDLQELIPNLENQDYDRFECIFVLNAGDDDTKQYLSSVDFDTKIIEPDENTWYSGGNNVGCEQASGEYVLILNPDTALAEDSLSELVQAAEWYPTAGVLAPKVLDFDSRETIDTYGMTLTRGGWHGSVGVDDPTNEWPQPLRVPAFDGPAALIRRAAIEQVGLFDQRFEFLVESVDLGLRLRKAGWEIITVPSAAVYHKGANSFDADERSQVEAYYGTRNSIHMIGKQYPAALLLLLLGNHIRWSLKRITYYGMDGDWDLVREQTKGLLEGLSRAISELGNRDPIPIFEMLSLIEEYPKNI